MMLSFAVFMTEAVLAYKAPWVGSFSRPQRKKVHVVMHSLAVTCAVLGLMAAWKSHTLKVWLELLAQCCWQAVAACW